MYSKKSTSMNKIVSEAESSMATKWRQCGETTICILVDLQILEIC